MEILALKILQQETDGFESQSRLRDDVIDAMIRFKNESNRLTKSEQLACFKCGNDESDGRSVRNVKICEWCEG